MSKHKLNIVGVIMKKIHAIVAKEVRETGTVSFKFMLDSKTPYR